MDVGTDKGQLEKYKKEVARDQLSLSKSRRAKASEKVETPPKT